MHLENGESLLEMLHFVSDSTVDANLFWYMEPPFSRKNSKKKEADLLELVSRVTSNTRKLVRKFILSEKPAEWTRKRRRTAKECHDYEVTKRKSISQSVSQSVSESVS